MSIIHFCLFYAKGTGSLTPTSTSAFVVLERWTMHQWCFVSVLSATVSSRLILFTVTISTRFWHKKDLFRRIFAKFFIGYISLKTIIGNAYQPRDSCFQNNSMNVLMYESTDNSKNSLETFVLCLNALIGFKE